MEVRRREGGVDHGRRREGTASWIDAAGGGGVVTPGDGDAEEFVPESLVGTPASVKLVWKKLNDDGPVSATTVCDELDLPRRTWRRARKKIDAETAGGVRSMSDPDDGRRDLYWVGDRADGTVRGERP